MNTKDSLFDLSTEVAPAPTFTIDDETYHLKTANHLSLAEEATVISLGALLDKVNLALVETPLAKESTVANLALKLTSIQVKMICQVTDVPEEVVSRLPFAAREVILNAFRDHFRPGSSREDAPEA